MPLLATQRYFSGSAGELPSRQGFPHWGLPPSRPAAFGTRDRLAVVRPHGGIVREILLQEPGCQFPCEGASTPFPLGEGDGGRMLSPVEIEIEGCSRLLQPLLPELFAGGVRCAWRLVHGCLPLMKKQGCSLSRLSHTEGAAAITEMDPKIPGNSPAAPVQGSL
jgi:hypothetical protein